MGVPVHTVRYKHRKEKEWSYGACRFQPKLSRTQCNRGREECGARQQSRQASGGHHGVSWCTLTPKREDRLPTRHLPSRPCTPNTASSRARAASASRSDSTGSRGGANGAAAAPSRARALAALAAAAAAAAVACAFSASVSMARARVLKPSSIAGAAAAAAAAAAPPLGVADPARWALTPPSTGLRPSCAAPPLAEPAAAAAVAAAWLAATAFQRAMRVRARLATWVRQGPRYGARCAFLSARRQRHSNARVRCPQQPPSCSSASQL